MKLAILACLAALCLAGHGAHAAPGEPAKAVVPAPAGPAPIAPAPAGTGPVNAAPPPAAQPVPRSAATARAERRRRSYAACNRASHQRSLRGGKRRRFLIRCRLGYERTRGQQIQGLTPAPGVPSAAPAPAPVQPGRKP